MLLLLLLVAFLMYLHLKQNARVKLCKFDSLKFSSASSWQLLWLCIGLLDYFLCHNITSAV